MVTTRKTIKTLGKKTDTNKAISRVAGYTRVSTEDQAESGLGLSAQQTKIQTMATLKDYTVGEIYEDAGISGTKAKRPSFNRLQDDIRNKRIDAIIVSSLDRIGRKAHIVMNFAALCAEYDVTFISVKETFDSSTPQGKFVLTMFAAVAELDGDTIRERITAALDERSSKYDYKAGMLPMGYTRIVEGNSEYIGIDDDSAAIVKSIYSMYRKGKSTYYIAKSLNRRNISSRRNSVWYPSSVQVIIDNEDVYKGKHTAYPKII